MFFIHFLWPVWQAALLNVSNVPNDDSRAGKSGIALPPSSPSLHQDEGKKVSLVLGVAVCTLVMLM
jgi:hypothetical protein